MQGFSGNIEGERKTVWRRCVAETIKLKGVLQKQCSRMWKYSSYSEMDKISNFRNCVNAFSSFAKKEGKFLGGISDLH
jgi:hypothetical protein